MPSPALPQRALAGGWDTVAVSCNLWAAGQDTDPSHESDLSKKQLVLVTIHNIILQTLKCM